MAIEDDHNVVKILERVVFRTDQKLISVNQGALQKIEGKNFRRQVKN